MPHMEQVSLSLSLFPILVLIALLAKLNIHKNVVYCFIVLNAVKTPCVVLLSQPSEVNTN